MRTLKKKDIKNYKPKGVEEKPQLEDCEEIELDEFVNSVGAKISGDAKNVNNSEIKTAPQATSADFDKAAIQGNRYLYNVNSVGGNVRMESTYKLAKEKLIKLLEGYDFELANSEDTVIDTNNNSVSDVNELPPHVASKLEGLIDTIKNNNLPDEQIDLIKNYIDSKLNRNAQ